MKFNFLKTTDEHIEFEIVSAGRASYPVHLSWEVIVDLVTRPGPSQDEWTKLLDEARRHVASGHLTGLRPTT